MNYPSAPQEDVEDHEETTPNVAEEIAAAWAEIAEAEKAAEAGAERDKALAEAEGKIAELEKALEGALAKGRDRCLKIVQDAIAQGEKRGLPAASGAMKILHAIANAIQNATG